MSRGDVESKQFYDDLPDLLACLVTVRILGGAGTEFERKVEG